MRDGKNIPLWFNEEDRRRVQEGAALAGYGQLSKYIRDRALGKHGEEAGGGSTQARAERQALGQRLASMEESLACTRAMLAMVLALVYKRATTGEVNALLAACEHAPGASDLVSGVAPNLAAALSRLSE